MKTVREIIETDNVLFWFRKSLKPTPFIQSSTE